MEKSVDAFRTISEVADILQTPAHVLRFWESRFPQIKPVKRAGGRRYYRPSDVALLAGIRKLLHDDGMTIRGVQKILREQGVRRVAELARAEEAGFIEVEAEDDPPTAEVHAFPARRRSVLQVDPDLAAWKFSPTSTDGGDDIVKEEEFFAKTDAGSHEPSEDGPPPPLSISDTSLARDRADRLRDPDMSRVEPPALTRPLLLRLLALEPGMLDAGRIRQLMVQLTAMRDRMDITRT